MTSESRPVVNEPVRGAVPPAWFTSMPGIDRIHALTKGLVPSTQITRLFGTRVSHVSAGTTTCRMPATANFLHVPNIDLSPLIASALWCSATSTVAAGYRVDPISMSKHYFRPPRPQPGNFLARAQVLNASRLFVCVAVDIEDPVGRQIGHAVGQYAVRAVEPPLLPVPDALRPVEEPSYPSPDPPERAPIAVADVTSLVLDRSGLDVAKMFASGELPPIPIQHVMGIRWLDLCKGETRMSMPASDWFRLTDEAVGEHALAIFLGASACTGALSYVDAGRWATPLEISSRYLRAVAVDGQELISRSRVRHGTDKVFSVESEVTDASGWVVATAEAVWAYLDLPDPRRAEPERVLATLLFTDIVDSSGQAQRRGDGPWRALLDEHHALVRRELLAHRGREINTAGDGFLARFDSPAAAVRAAMAIRDGVRRLGLEVRAGLHTGECEVRGHDLAGIALHVAARLVSLAGPNEIVTSQMVRDLTAGSGLHFTARGSHALKGIDGEWSVFAVDGA